ncbi:MAG TPA: type II 3-dehydroquinate dehydratase [Candidatus Eremiobacteraceae bacterium]
MNAANARKSVAVIHGPNLNLLGTREPDVYGAATLDDIDASIRALAGKLGCEVSSSQHSGEGQIIDAVHAAAAAGSAIVINPGAYAHYSLAIRDALSAARVPKVEVHLTNIFAREIFRRSSVIAPAVDGVVAGFGAESYLLALRAVAAMLDKQRD